ncbi:sensor histidine kinase [Streptomyces iconiensis]|uniref:histidine kinase n=1 Tax=Streptomyces iconiensis TaxID=1384038 RepID=A0ABT7A1Q7_9ACTN|nr:histidine kinase [Streptomyces iconiensis]MDJ1135273.1 histidine kinase [Streptomyces iconiensis]
MRRTGKDWLADIGMFLFAALFFLVTADSVVAGSDISGTAVLAEQAAGGVACAALFVRRRWPVALAVLLLVSGKFSHFMTGPCLVALFTVAATRPPRVTGWVAALGLAPLPFYLASGPPADDPRTGSALTFFALVACALGWGSFVRSRRQLIASLEERAEHAATDARREAREDVAREMHDVLAHRLSLLSVHAGALEFNPGGNPEQVSRAAGVIRESAHEALQDLREIIGVLRAPEAHERPQPVLADLEQLVEESRGAGARVTLVREVPGEGEAGEREEVQQGGAQQGGVPAVTGRTAYRIVQEGLTNARKHGPGPEVPVSVSVRGGPGQGLTVEVRNPGKEPQHHEGAHPAVPGSGQGLVGLTERAHLAGGHLEHGWDDGDFRLRAWLPWPG